MDTSRITSSLENLCPCLPWHVSKATTAPARARCHSRVQPDLTTANGCYNRRRDVPGVSNPGSFLPLRSRFAINHSSSSTFSTLSPHHLCRVEEHASPPGTVDAPLSDSTSESSVQSQVMKIRFSERSSAKIVVFAENGMKPGSRRLKRFGFVLDGAPISTENRKMEFPHFSLD